MLFGLAAAASHGAPVRLLDATRTHPRLRDALELAEADVGRWPPSRRTGRAGGQVPAQPGNLDLSRPVHLVYVDTARFAQPSQQVSRLLTELLESDLASPVVALIDWAPASTSTWAKDSTALLPAATLAELERHYGSPQAWRYAEVAARGGGRRTGTAPGDPRSLGVGVVFWSVIRSGGGAPPGGRGDSSTAPGAARKETDTENSKGGAEAYVSGDVSRLLEEAAMLREELDRDLFRLARRFRGVASHVPFALPLARRAYHGAKRARHVLHGRPTRGPEVPLDPPGTEYPLRDRWLNFREPQVSIVILNFNRGDLTLAALQHVWRNSAGTPYEVLVVDNGSSAQDMRAARQHHAYFRETRLSVNRYFGEGNNLGAEDAKGQFLIFLNNDALPQPGWLEPLMAVLKDPAVGAAGSRLLFPDGRIQETGAMIHPDGAPVQLEKGWPADRGTKEPVRAVDYCSAAALGIRKEVFERAGGFDLTWEPAYYEDVDLCLTVRGLGLEVFCATQSHVVHLEHATTASTGHGLDLRGQPEFNRRKFVARWGATLRAEGGVKSLPGLRSDQGPRRSGPQIRSGIRIGLYTPYQLVPGGGERYLLMLAAAAAGRGGAVTFLFQERFSALRVRQLARELDVALPASFEVGTYGSASSRPPFDLFVAMGNEVFPPVAGLGRRNVYVCQFPFPATRSLLQSRAALDAVYHTVFVYSRFAARAYTAARAQASAVERQPVVVYPPCGAGAEAIPSREAGRAFQIVSVGRFFQGGHEKRHDVMIRAFSKVRAQLAAGQQAELHLVGSAMQQWGSRAYLAWLERLARDLPVTFHLNASAEQVRSLLNQSDVYWHAAGFGVDEARHPERLEHFGISIVEAMARHCVPIAYDAGGPKEIITPGLDGLLYRTEAALVSETLRIAAWAAAGSEELASLRARAALRANDFTDAAFSERVAAVLDDRGVR